MVMRLKEKRHWCDCPNGPQPGPPPVPSVRISGFSARRDALDDRVSITFPEAEEIELTLDCVSKINYRFWKPIEISIDLTVEVPAR